jgi:hypothetical protein
MKMRMMVQVLSPGMEHRQKSDLSAEVFRVGANLEQRLRRGFEQTAVNQPLVLERQWAQCLRQREHHMKVLDRQELRLASFEPSRAAPAPARRAMAITAGAVGDRSLAALVALIDVAAESGSSAERNITKCTLLLI